MISVLCIVACPNCGSSEEIHQFKNGCTLLEPTGNPQYGCGNCHSVFDESQAKFVKSTADALSQS